MSNFDQYNEVSNASVILFGGDTFAFYANLDDLETDSGFANWHLDLLDEDFNVAVADIGTLTQDVISGSSYRFYSSFVVPYNLTPGCYRLAVIDEFYDQVKYISFQMTYKSKSSYTKLVRYRNSKNILNYNYEGLPSFYNTFRVEALTRQPLNQVNQTGYDLVDGSFNPVRTILGQTFEFVLSWADADAHQGFEAATIHSNFEIGDNQGWKQYIRNSDYQIDWIDDYPLADGTIRLQKKTTYSSNKAQ